MDKRLWYKYVPNSQQPNREENIAPFLYYGQIIDFSMLYTTNAI